MNLISTASLGVVILIWAAIPGPGVFATVARSLSSGFRPALAVITGIVAGDAVYLTFAVFGLSLIAQSMGRFFFLVKICGGAYLVWLGLKMWLEKTSEIESRQLKGKYSKAGNFTSGLLVSLSNPKVILFYCGFLPTFVDLKDLKPVDTILVYIVITAALSAVLITYAYLTDHARQLFSSQTALKNLNRSAGSAMMATGVAIALKS